MKKNLLAGLMAVLFASGAQAFDPFTIKDIRVEGIQRTEAGTVFSYLPVKVGDTMTNQAIGQAVERLGEGVKRGGTIAAGMQAQAPQMQAGIRQAG